jgi:hypothetical protein
VDGLLRHEEALLAMPTEDQRQDLAAQLKTPLASLARAVPASANPSDHPADDAAAPSARITCPSAATH